MGLSAYLEDLDSQIPAIQVLHALGWQYLSREEALALRAGRRDQVILAGILRPWLERHNRIEVRGHSCTFSEANITEAIRRLMDAPPDGLVRANEKAYHLLTLGTSLDQTIDGDRKGRSLKYIDWLHPENNVYHVADEFSVECSRSRDTRRPDLVLFVNGIPFVVIECGRHDPATQPGECVIDQVVRRLAAYQEQDEIPHLFHYAQLLFAATVSDIRYGTVHTPPMFWCRWEEEGAHEQAVHAAANQRLPADVEAKLFAPLERRHAEGYRGARRYFQSLWAAGDRLATAQDRTLWAMLRPKRLLEFVYGYVVFDAGARRVARYPQFFAVRAAVERLARHADGMIWHATGSGKSLTMVMLAKALVLHPAIPNPRVVLVSDRVDLDEQIWRTFQACGRAVVRARTGKHLVRLVTEGKASLITAVTDKFAAVVDRQGRPNAHANVFVLLDEGQRAVAANIMNRMRRVFPNAAFVTFTGTPLLKAEKSAADRFGGLIHRYTMRHAAEDRAAVPLRYECRLQFNGGEPEALQRWLTRMARGLSVRRKAELERAVAGDGAGARSERRIRMIACDINVHYGRNFRNTGLKGQLAAASCASAILYRRYLQECGMTRCEVILPAPGLRDQGAGAEDEHFSLVAAFWSEMMHRFGSEEEYNRQILASFARDDGVELLIVADKLLSGFDEPRNTVLYIDRPLRERALIQALARVNRLFAGDKQSGFVIDYRGVLGGMSRVTNVYEALAGFEAADADLKGVLIDTRVEVSGLARQHAAVWAIFDEAPDRLTDEAQERWLAAESRRHAFYEALRVYQQTLAVALTTGHFYDDTPASRIRKYKEDLIRFRRLRASVQRRYADTPEVGACEGQINALLARHVRLPPAAGELIGVFDADAFDAEVARRGDAAAQADTICHRVKRTVEVKMEESPVFYREFVSRVQQSIDDYRAGRIDGEEYRRLAQRHLETVRRGHEVEDMPECLEGHREAQAYYGVLGEVMAGKAQRGERAAGAPVLAETPAHYRVASRRPAAREDACALVAQMALEIEGIIAQYKIRDWAANQDALKCMEDAVDDYLLDVRDMRGIALEIADVDLILQRCLDIARKLGGA